MTGAIVQVVVVIDTDTSRHLPRQFRNCARGAWRDAVMRSYSHGRMKLVVAEELIRAWPDAEPRR